MNRNEYKQKILEMLDDSEIYVKIKKKSNQNIYKKCSKITQVEKDYISILE